MTKSNSTSRTRKETRRLREFRAALALNNETVAGFAEKNGVSQSHLSLVLSGVRESGRLDIEIDKYVAAFREDITSSAAAA